MKIYRFRNISINTYRELITRKVWFSRYAYLNDPFEGNYINNSGQNDLDEILKDFEICSYSKRKNNLLMWSHYADSHKGVCLEYEIDDTEYKKSYFEVTYSKNQPIIENIRKNNHGMVKISESAEFQVFLTKSPDWKYEKEIRTIHSGFFETKGTLKKEPGKLSAVYFGLHASDRHIDDIDTILEKDKNIRFYKAEFKEGKYKLLFNKIERPTKLTIDYS